MILAIIFIYLAFVLSIGLLSHRLFRGTGIDYFIATRTIGPFILLMSLFGTHMTAFALLGASGEAYHNGIGVFGLMASSSAIVAPAVFFFVGTRAWSLGNRFGYLTQVQYFRDRWGSEVVGGLMFVVLVAFMIPYLLIGVMGGGITMAEITEGMVPEWVGGLVVCLVILTYVTYGGLRGTAWANTFQTLVFMTLGAVTFFVIVNKLGGLQSALIRVSQNNPELLMLGDEIQPLKFLTYMLIPLSVGMFPHIFMHWLSARRAETFKYAIMFYPLCVAVVWIPSILLGVLGSIEFPGLRGPEANSILVQMIGRYAPGVLAGMLAAGVFAAVMSSLDSQVLALGAMFTHDVVKRFRTRKPLSEKQQILFGRFFVVAVLVITYVLSLVANRSIFKLAIWSFTGFTSLLPILLAALFWKRSTWQGAAAAIVGTALSWVYLFVQGWQSPGYTIGDTGIMPVAAIFLISALCMGIGSLLSSVPEKRLVEKFFPAHGGAGVAVKSSGPEPVVRPQDAM